MTIQVALYSRVQGTYPNTRNHLGRVAYLTRAQYQFVLEEIDILVDICQTSVGHRQRTSRCTQHTTLLHQAHGSILQHLGVDIEIRHLAALSQSTQYSIRSASYTRLQVQERTRNQTAPEVVQQEISNILANLAGHGVRILESTGLIRNVTLDYTHYTVRIHLDIRLAYTVTRLRYHYRLAVWMVLDLIYVMDTLALGTVE